MDPQSSNTSQTLGQSSFFYYNPESATDQRQHGHFSPHPKSVQDRAQMQQYQQQWIHQHTMYNQPPMMYHQVPSSTIMPQKGVMATPRPMQQRPTFLYQQDGQALALDTDCNAPDLHVYPSTPTLSVSGSTVSSPPSTCGILPTPVTCSYMGLEIMEGVKEGCHGDVKTEILAGEEFTRCDSPPLRPVFIHPPSVTASQASDLLSLNSCPSLSPSPSPVSHAPTTATEAKLSFCDPRNLLVDSQNPITQIPAPEFPPLPTLCSGDDEEHKLILGGDFALMRQESHFSKALDTCVSSTLSGLPHFDSFSDLDSENEFVTDLTRFSPSQPAQYLGDKRQRLDLISFDEEEFLSEDSFDDLEDGDSFASPSLLTPPESRRPSEDESGNMKTTKKRSSLKKQRKEESLEATESDVQAFSNTNESSSEDTSAAQDTSIQTSTAPSSDGNAAASGNISAPASSQATARRGRKQSLTDDPSKTFVCDICARRFRRQEHLKRHHRSLHTHDKPFECNECGKKFSRSDNLSQHARTHGSGAIVMGVLEEGELPPVGSGNPLDTTDAGTLGAVLFEAAKAAAGTSSSSSATTVSDRDTGSPAPSVESTKPAKKRKRED